MLADTEQIFSWRNEPWIVALSMSRKPVVLEEHRHWMERVTKDERHLLFIIEVATDQRAGLVRLERANSNATITIYLMRDFTGKGLGVWAIQEACQRAFREWKIDFVTAHIQDTNHPSISAFAKAGFLEALGGSASEGHVEMVLSRPRPAA